MVLVRPRVHQEHQRVVVFNFLHRGFGRQRVFNDVVRVHATPVRHGFPGVFRVSGGPERFGAVEVHREADFTQARAIRAFDYLGIARGFRRLFLGDFRGLNGFISVSVV